MKSQAMKNKKKTFDSVRTMREIRDALSRETAKMKYEEQKRYMREYGRGRFEKNVKTRR